MYKSIPCTSNTSLQTNKFIPTSKRFISTGQKTCQKNNVTFFNRKISELQYSWTKHVVNICSPIKFFLAYKIIPITLNNFTNDYWVFFILFTEECRYSKGSWSECDSKTNMRSRTLTLKKGNQTSCEPTKTIQKKCKKGKKYVSNLFWLKLG